MKKRLLNDQWILHSGSGHGAGLCTISVGLGGRDHEYGIGADRSTIEYAR